MFDLWDRESDDEREVLDIGGVPAKGTLTVKSTHRVLVDPCGCKVESKWLWSKRRCYRDWEVVARRWLKARFAWHFSGVGTQESGENTWSGKGGDVESEDLRVLRGVWSMSPKGYVPLGIYSMEKTRGLIEWMWTVGLAETNGHNKSIEDYWSMLCNFLWEVTRIDLGVSRDSRGNDRTYGATHSVGCPNSRSDPTRRVWPVLLDVTRLIGWLRPAGLNVL